MKLTRKNQARRRIDEKDANLLALIIIALAWLIVRHIVNNAPMPSFYTAAI